MHGKVQMETIKLLMPTFFEQLAANGQIDLALAVARARIQHDQPDWWMPVLYMTLKNGRLGWYTPGFEQDEDSFRKWRGLRSSIRDSSCTPIIGMGPIESWFGSRQMMAQNWARKFNYPLSSHFQDDLPQVAQYVAISESSTSLPRYDFIDHVYAQTWAKYGDVLREDGFAPVDQPDPADLNDLMLAVWQKKNQDAERDPYTTIAALNQTVYLLADPSDLLVAALKAQGCDPQIRIAPWNDDARDLNEIYDEDAPEGWKPSQKQPVVYYLFGRLDKPRTMVITEDDYFDYLIQLTEHRHDIPDYIRGALARRSLVFLGFRFQDWEFRTFFRFLMNQKGKLSRETHIAAQLEPTEHSIIEPSRAKDYLKQYLQQEQIDIFWGRTIDFFKAYNAADGKRS